MGFSCQHVMGKLDNPAVLASVSCLWNYLYLSVCQCCEIYYFFLGCMFTGEQSQPGPTRVSTRCNFDSTRQVCILIRTKKKVEQCWWNACQLKFHSCMYFITEFNGCPYGPDPTWNITWANTEREATDVQRCPGGVDTLGTCPCMQYSSSNYLTYTNVQELMGSLIGSHAW